MSRGGRWVDPQSSCQMHGNWVIRQGHLIATHGNSDIDDIGTEQIRQLLRWYFEGPGAGSGSWTFGDQLVSLCPSVKTLERPCTVRTAAEEESKPWHMRLWQGNATSHLPEQRLIEIEPCRHLQYLNYICISRELARHFFEIFGVPSHRTGLDPTRYHLNYEFLNVHQAS